MKHKKEDKKKQPENEIREGREDNVIHREKKESARESYPKPSLQDEQNKNQPEFIDDEPNRMDNGEWLIKICVYTSPKIVVIIILSNIVRSIFNLPNYSHNSFHEILNDIIPGILDSYVNENYIAFTRRKLLKIPL